MKNTYTIKEIKDFLRVNTFARGVRKSGQTVRNWIKAGKLDSIEIDGSHHIPKDAEVRE